MSLCPWCLAKAIEQIGYDKFTIAPILNPPVDPDANNYRQTPD